MALKTDLDKLAQTIAKNALQDSVSLQDRIDAFKALTTYYSAQKRGRKNAEPDSRDGETFDDFSRAIAEGDHGRAQVRGGRADS